MGAAYNSQERSPAPRCLPGTRKEVLEEIDDWVEAGADGASVLWLHGPAGAGKSAIAQTVAETCAERNQLAASLFFARTAAHRNEAKYLFPTMAVQIALSAPEKRRRLDEILSSDPYIAERSSGSVELLASLLKERSAAAPQASSPFLIIVDGLDECQRKDDQCWILAQVSRMVHTHHLPLRFLIVSRPESHLQEAFEDGELANIAQVLSLYGDHGATRDVSMYLRSEFSRIYGAKKHRAVMRFVPQPWPSDDTIERLVWKSDGYFIYASTVIKFIDEEYESPAARLDQVLSTSNSSLDRNPFAELDQLYIQILSSYPTSHLPMLKQILGYAVMTPLLESRGLHLPSIEAILDLAPGQIELTLRRLQSLASITVFSFSSIVPRLIHASFGDFLLDRFRAKQYHIDSEEWLYASFRDGFSLAYRSLDAHYSVLQRLGGQFLVFLIEMIRDQCADSRWSGS